MKTHFNWKGEKHRKRAALKKKHCTNNMVTSTNTYTPCRWDNCSSMITQQKHLHFNFISVNNKTKSGLCCTIKEQTQPTNDINLLS